EMRKENLFFWPLNFLPYQPDEGQAGNFPFPNYENGDIFLSWGELAVRAYAKSQPEIAVKYIKNILEKYEADGLSFQRYLRNSQRGAGEDILAGNCMPVVGLYRDIYGIQPKYNRLYLEPHLTPDLNGTVVNYDLRGRHLKIELAVNAYRVSYKGITFQSSHPFGIDFGPNGLTCFPGDQDKPVFTMQARAGEVFTATVRDWGKDQSWMIKPSSHTIVLAQTFHFLQPVVLYRIVSSGQTIAMVSSDKPAVRIRCEAGKVTELHLIPDR